MMSARVSREICLELLKDAGQPLGDRHNTPREENLTTKCSPLYHINTPETVCVEEGNRIELCLEDMILSVFAGAALEGYLAD